MSATSRAEWKIYWLLFFVTVGLFLFGLVVFAFSGVDLRQRSEKAACERGDVAACLQVGHSYEDRAPGLIGFLMSNADTAIRSYTRACAGRSGEGCEHMVQMLQHSEQAANLSVPMTEIVDAALGSCIEQVPGACDQLGELLSYGKWVEVRSAQAFERGCGAGKPEACYRLAVFHANELGGLDKTLETILPLYEKGCAGGIAQACTLADAWRTERDRRAAAQKK